MKKRLNHIDTLRFIAVLIILLSHFEEQCSTVQIMDSAVEGGMGNVLLYGLTGKYALALMAVISGYVVAYTYSNRSVSMPGYIFNRYIRMMLPCALVNLVIYVCTFLDGSPYDISTAAASFFYPGKDFMNPHFWCIGQLLIGDVILLVYMQLFCKKKFYLIGLALVFAVMVQMGQPWMAGIILGGLVYYGAEWLESKHYMRWYIALPIILLAWWIKRDINDVFSNRLFGLQDISQAMILLVICSMPALQRLFSCSFCNKLKKLSYSLFCCHYLTQDMATKIMTRIERTGLMQGAPLYWATLAGKFAVDLVIAVLLYYITDILIYPRLKQGTGAKDT